MALLRHCCLAALSVFTCLVSHPGQRHQLCGNFSASRAMSRQHAASLAPPGGLGLPSTLGGNSRPLCCSAAPPEVGRDAFDPKILEHLAAQTPSRVRVSMLLPGMLLAWGQGSPGSWGLSCQPRLGNGTCLPGWREC